MNAAFRWLWAGAGISNLGDGITLTALPLLALAAGAGPGEVALVATAATIAWPIFGLHAGWIVDRASLPRLLVLVNAARTLTLATLALAIATDRAVVWAVTATALVYGIAETLVDTALTAAVPHTVGRRLLTPANARIEATINVTNLLAGPPVAGFLVGVSGVLAATSGAGLYLVAGLAAIALGIGMRRRSSGVGRDPSTASATPSPPGTSAAEDDAAEKQARPLDSRVREGVRFLWNHPLQRELTLLTAAMSLVWGAWSAVFVLHAVEPGPLGLEPEEYGWLLAAMAVGGIAASAATQWLERRLGRTMVLFIDAIGTIGLVLPAALGAPAAAVAAGIVLAGAGSTVWRIIVSVVRQQTTPNHLIGRVYSASRVISWGALPLGSALAALGVELIGLGAVLLTASAVAVGVAAWFAIRWRFISTWTETPAPAETTPESAPNPTFSP